MARSGRKQPWDREPGFRGFDNPDVPVTGRVFTITEAQRQQVAKCLRYIDEARRELESQRNPDNREIIRELRSSADRIYDLINGLEDTEIGIRTPLTSPAE